MPSELVDIRSVCGHDVSDMSDKELLRWMYNQGVTAEDLHNAIAEKIKVKWLEDEITTTKFIHIMNDIDRNAETELEEVATERYQEAQEKFAEGEITEEELERELEVLSGTDTDFTNEEEDVDGGGISDTLSYYSVPIVAGLIGVGALTIAVFSLPSFAFILAPTLVFVGAFLYGLYSL